MSHDTNGFSWVLPLAKTQGNTDTPQQYLQKLSHAQGGFYPMGANSLWHGGIHLDNETGLTPHCTIGCITDGEVIAYRVDKNYSNVTAELAEPESVKPDVEPMYREENASYSSGFVLVRHRLKIPAFPPPTVAATAPDTDLTFYSLYMHLCDWGFYVTADKLPRPAYWGKPMVFEVADKSKDRITGCIVRSGGAHTTKLAILPRGTSIVIGEKHPDSIGKDDSKSWFKLDSLVAGEALNIPPNNLSVIGCYVFPGEMTRIGDLQYRVAERGHDFDSSLLGHNIYSKPKAEASALLSVLPRGAKVQISHQEGRWGKIEKLLTDKAYPALPTDAEGKIQSWNELPKLTPISTPLKTDDVVVLAEPYPVKTDELMGYPGMYQDLGNAPAQTPDDALLVHIEVFTPEDMPALIKRTSELAAQQPVSEKTRLKVNQGAVLYQPRVADQEIATETQLIRVDTPKAKDLWLEVQKVSMGIVDKKLLGPYTSISSHPIRGAYSVSLTNKPSIAEALNVQAQDVPDTVFFRGECLDQNGKRLNTVSPPATHSLREIYFPLANDSDSYWIDADKLDQEGKKVNPGRVIVAWSQFPLQEDNQQVGTVSFEQVFSRSEIEVGQHCQDHQGTGWWLLKTGKQNSVIGTESFGEITGWIKDAPPGVTHHHPWEWPLFHTVQETATPAQTLERNLRQRLDPADRTLLMQKLYTILGAATQPVANSDVQEDTVLLKKENLKAALNVPWLAQQFSHLVVNYESEWFADENLSKWNEIDEMLKKYLCTPRASSETDADYNQRIAIEVKPWQAEKEQRIKKLLWWDKVAGKHAFPADTKVWHLHPVGLIDNFFDHDNDPKWLIVPRGQFTFDVEGNDFEGSRYFSRVAHWPEGASGITIGRGYDLGQRPNPESDLADVGITGAFYGWLIGAKGLQGATAQRYLNNASAEIRKTPITRKQQHDLFLLIYDIKKDDVISISNDQRNMDRYGQLAWNNLDPRIQDMVVDLIYRGDYTPPIRTHIQSAIVNNDIVTFRAAINNRTIWLLNLPQDRFQRRINYMR